MNDLKQENVLFCMILFFEPFSDKFYESNSKYYITLKHL